MAVKIFSYLGLVDPHILNLTVGLHVDDEFRALAKHTLYFNRASHLFDNVFTDRESKTRALAISLRALIQLPEINEELIQAFLCYSYPRINYAYLQLDKSFLSIFQGILLVIADDLLLYVAFSQIFVQVLVIYLTHVIHIREFNGSMRRFFRFLFYLFEHLFKLFLRIANLALLL